MNVRSAWCCVQLYSVFINERYPFPCMLTTLDAHTFTHASTRMYHLLFELVSNPSLSVPPGPGKARCKSKGKVLQALVESCESLLNSTI